MKVGEPYIPNKLVDDPERDRADDHNNQSAYETVETHVAHRWAGLDTMRRDLP